MNGMCKCEESQEVGCNHGYSEELLDYIYTEPKLTCNENVIPEDDGKDVADDIVKKDKSNKNILIEMYDDNDENDDAVDIEVEVKKFFFLPRKMTSGSAGYDLDISQPMVLKPKEIKMVSTGLKLNMPPGVYCEVKDRSSLWRSGISVLRGVIDNDYTDEIKLVFENRNDFEKKISGRVAQLIFYRSCPINLVVVNDIKRKTTERKGGFGSTDEVVNEPTAKISKKY